MSTVRQLYGQTDKWTDGRLTIAKPRLALRASRGKNDIHGCHWLGWNAKYFHANCNVSEKHASRTAGCTDSSSHSFSKRATISGIPKGAGDMGPYAFILQTISWHHVCCFKHKMYQNPYQTGLRPDPAGGSYDAPQTP